MMIHRRGYTRKDGTRVSPTKFSIKNRGSPGHGKKVFPALKKGALKQYGYSLKLGNSARHSALNKARKHMNVGTLKKRLEVLVIFFKRTKPVYSNRAYRNRLYIK